MRESRTTIKYRDQDYTICVDDDTRSAIDDVVKYQKSHPERTMVTTEPKLKPLRPYAGQKKSRFERFLDWFWDPMNSGAAFVICLFVMLVSVALGIIVGIHQKKNRSERHTTESRTEKSMFSNKPSYEVIEFK